MKGIDLSHIGPKQEVIKPQEKESIWQKDIRLGAIMSQKEKQNFFQMLHVLLSSGLGIMDAFSLIEKQSKKKSLQKVYEKMQHELLAGISLSDAMENQSKVFTPFEIHSIRMGEQSSRLDTVLQNLSAYYEKRIKLRRKVSQALSYPIAVILIASGVLTFMVLFVVPMFEDIFSRFDQALPPITQCILDLSAWLGENIYYLLLGLLLSAGILFYVLRLDAVKNFLSHLLLKIPFIGKLLSKLYLSRLAYSFSMMLSAKVNLDKALELLKETIGFYPYKKALGEIKDDIIEGKSLYEGFNKHTVFPEHFTQIIRVGEKSAKLDKVISRLAQSLEEESEAGISQLTQFLEPLLIIILGSLVAIILIAMYLPMFELSTAIS